MTSLQRRFPATLVSAVGALALAFWVVAASAQTPAALALPKPDCGAKPDFPGRLASDKQKTQWRKDALAYVECYKKFATDRRELAAQYQDAANAAIAEGASLEQVTEEHFDRHFDINVKGTVFTMQKALPLVSEGASIIVTPQSPGSKDRLVSASIPRRRQRSAIWSGRGCSISRAAAFA